MKKTVNMNLSKDISTSEKIYLLMEQRLAETKSSGVMSWGM